MTIKVPMNVEMDDGRTLNVVIDQRDYAAVEAQEGIDRHQHRNMYARYLAYNALARTKQYIGPWEQFNGVDCVEALAVEQEEPDDAERLDPGQPAASAGA
jgi:hypothetical protein